MNTAELWIALSTVSAEGLWILGQGPRLLAHSQWEDSESHGLSETLELRLNQILENNGLKLQHIQRIGVVTGPGAFTGLRVSTAYTQGLARALSVPIFGITSFDLVGSPFFIPLRHQKTKLLSLAECLTQGHEFLRLRSPTEFEIATPDASSQVLGTNSNPLWPSPEQLLQAALKSWSNPVELRYGTGPRVFGVRLESS